MTGVSQDARDTAFVSPGFTGPVLRAEVVKAAAAVFDAAAGVADEGAADEGAADDGAMGNFVCDTGQTVVYATIVLVCMTGDWRDAGQ